VSIADSTPGATIYYTTNGSADDVIQRLLGPNYDYR